MLTFDAGIFADALDDVARLEALLESNDGWLDVPDHRTYFKDKFIKLGKELDHLGLKVSKYKAQQIHVAFESADPFMDGLAKRNTVQRSCQSLRESLLVELSGRKFYGPLPGYEKYYDQVQLFGADVFQSFGSATEDIFEAGMCLSLERGTACVMHLMRVLEAGLLALANAVGVTNKNDWGSYLKLIEAELDKRLKAAGARSPDEQFYSEAATNFDRVRRAFRNPTMHVGASYSLERAGEILLATKSFMAHLATRLSENS